MLTKDLITEPVLVKNPTGEGHINLGPFLNIILEWQAERDPTQWPTKLQHVQERLEQQVQDVELNLDITDLSKATYQNILSTNHWMLQLVRSIQLVKI